MDGKLLQGVELLDFPNMVHERAVVVKTLLEHLGIPDALNAEVVQEGGHVSMWLCRVNGAAFMPFKFGTTPAGMAVWQWEELAVL